MHGSLLCDIADDTFEAKRDWSLAQEEKQYDSSSESRQYDRPTKLEYQPIDLSQLFPPPRRQRREFQSTFSALQEWEGYVLSVSAETFSARLIDLTECKEYEEEEIDFPLADLSDSDLKELRLGAIFRWAIGYRRTRGGTKERISKVVFRRLPAWTKRELENNRRKAEEWAIRLVGE